MVLDLIRRRIPTRNEITSAFGTVVFFVHSWAVYGFVHEVPSFILYFDLGQILTILAYMMAFALVESIVVTLGLIALAMLLPGKWFREGFVHKCLLTILLWASFMLWMENTLLVSSSELPEGSILVTGVGLALVTWVGLVFLAHKLKVAQSVLVGIVERIEVLAYLYVPLGSIGLLVVLVRNLL